MGPISTGTFACVQIFARATSDSDAMIVGLSGEFDIAGVAAVRSQVHSLLADGWTDVIVDLEDIGFVDSAGLGVLIGLHRRCREANGMLALAAPSLEVRRVLETSELDTILELHPTVADAETALVGRPSRVADAS